MACRIIRNSNKEVIEVVASNGNPSHLFRNILDGITPDRELALRAYAQVFTPEFKNLTSGEALLDSNGEPQLHRLGEQIVFATPNIAVPVTTEGDLGVYSRVSYPIKLVTHNEQITPTQQQQQIRAIFDSWRSKN